MVVLPFFLNIFAVPDDDDDDVCNLCLAEISNELMLSSITFTFIINKPGIYIFVHDINITNVYKGLHQNLS